MQVDDQEKYEFNQLEESFDNLSRAQIGNFRLKVIILLSRSTRTNLRARSEELKEISVALEQHLSDCVEGQGREDVNRKLTSQVMLTNHFDFFDLGTCTLVDVGGAETDYDVYEEKRIDDDIYGNEKTRLEHQWIEANIQRNHKHIERCQDHHEKIPLRLERVIDAKHARRLRFCLAHRLRMKVVFDFILLVQTFVKHWCAISLTRRPALVFIFVTHIKGILLSEWIFYVSVTSLVTTLVTFIIFVLSYIGLLLLATLCELPFECVS